MRVDHTPTSRSATIATALLVIVQLIHLVAGTHEAYIDALLLALVLATATASVKLHRDNCVESRLIVSLLAVTSGAGVALAVTVGLPGQVVRPWDVLDATILVLSAAVVALFTVDQTRRAGERRARSPYAL
jgi:predicted neutral ceramidase superfamily lipid hydrolase